MQATAQPHRPRYRHSSCLCAFQSQNKKVRAPACNKSVTKTKRPSRKQSGAAQQTESDDARPDRPLHARSGTRLLTKGQDTESILRGGKRLEGHRGVHRTGTKAHSIGWVHIRHRRRRQACKTSAPAASAGSRWIWATLRPRKKARLPIRGRQAAAHARHDLRHGALSPKRSRWLSPRAQRQGHRRVTRAWRTPKAILAQTQQRADAR